MSCRLSRNNSKTKNSSNAGKGSNNTNNNSFNYSLNHSSDKIINTPKRDTTMVSKCKSVDKLSKVSRKGSISTLDPNETSVNHYLQRRHTEAQEKLMKLKLEKQKKEILELRDRPKISENSKRIVERITNGVNVYDRLTNKNNQRRKDEEIRRLETLTKPVSKPCINETSEKLQRTIDDLYEWQRKLDEKKTNLSNNQNKRVCQRPQILRQSEDMLREKMPDYLYTKVEDRLLERGRM